MFNLHRTLLAALVFGALGAAPLTTPAATYLDCGGMLGSGTCSSALLEDGGGTIGSGTRSELSFLDDDGYFGSGH